MTSKHKRRTPLIRRLTSIVAVFAIFIMSVPMASAAELEGTLSGTIIHNSTSTSSNMGTYTSWSGITIPSTSATKQTTAYANTKRFASIGKFTINGAETYGGNVGVYISFYLTQTDDTWSSTDILEAFTGSYTNHMGQSGTVSVDVKGFTPTVSGYVSRGHSISAKFVGTEELPISDLVITATGTDFANAITYSETRNNSNYLVLNFPSVRVVTTEYSAELDAMENMADAIAEQNQIMQAMYGEIIALCNAILTKCGDLETAIGITNSYCSSMLNALGDIATNTSNIYTLLGTQFALLISTIETESSNIQDTIMEAEAKLEAYLDSAVKDSGIEDSGTASEDASSAIGDLNSGSSGYESTASDSFAQISADFAGFSGGTLSGVALATDLFSQVFNALGEYKVVYTFPLLLGVCLVLIGRISRHSGGASSRKEDKEE